MLATRGNASHPWDMAVMTLGMNREEQSLSSRLNWLRAGVLGANDGIVSTAGLVVGVAGATTNSAALLIAGLAGMVAGSLSMAGGEYVSVSSQRDTEIAALTEQRRLAQQDPATLRAELRDYYRHQGLPDDLAEEVSGRISAEETADHHARALLGLDVDEQVSPWAAARASLVAFVLGAAIPLLAMVLSPAWFRLPGTVGAVVAALIATGWVSARLGGARPLPAVTRNVLVGSATMALTWIVGTAVGTQLA